MVEFDATPYFLTVEQMGSFFGVFVPYVGWGLGLAGCFWGLGHIMWFVIDALRY